MSAKEFQIISKLGEGSYSNVYKVKRTSDNQEYAMKKVKLGSLNDKEKENALNEVRILASIKSPYVVGYKEAFFEDDLTLCIVMEYAAGGDMYDRIMRHQKSKTYIPEGDIWRQIIQMILGLKSLHDLKILHRDLKSANVFLSKDVEYAKLGDLNVSKVAKNNLVYTQTGTPYYASPEVWRDQPYNKKSDIWSIGCVFYEMCALCPPFRTNDMKGLFQKVQKGHFERIPTHYSVDLQSLIAMCLQVSPSMRPNCDQLLAHPIIQRHGGDTFRNIGTPPESNELLSTIRIPKNIKALTKYLPKPNYSQDVSYSADLQEEKMSKAAGTYKEIRENKNKRAVSQNVSMSRAHIPITKPLSRDVRGSYAQNVSPVPPKESERDYLDRLQVEFIEKARVIKSKEMDRLPDIHAVNKIRSRVPSNQSTLRQVMADYNEYKPRPNNERRYYNHEDLGEDRYQNHPDTRRILEPRKTNEAYGYKRGEASQTEKSIAYMQIPRENSEVDIYQGKNYYVVNKYDGNKSREMKYLADKNLSRVSSENLSLAERKAEHLLNKYCLKEEMSYRNNLDFYPPDSKKNTCNDTRVEAGPADYLDQYSHLQNLRKSRQHAQGSYDVKNYNSQPVAVADRRKYY